MEFRCQACRHLGPAASVEERDGTVGAVCESCGTWSPLTGGSQSADSVDSGGSDSPEQTAETPPATDEHDYRKIKQSLRPEPGEGPRCPKCAHLLETGADNCPRCGLNLERAAAYDAGEAPWETPPEGLEDAHERAEHLWETARSEAKNRDDGGFDPESLEAYVQHVSERNLLEFAVRRLRFYLADHPNDEHALEALDELAGRLQDKVAVAEARVESDTEDFSEEVETLQRILPWVVLLLTVVVVGLLFLMIFG